MESWTWLHRTESKNTKAQICAFPLTLCATWRGVCPVNPGLSPDLSTADTHLPSLANCQGKWDGPLISWRVWITLMWPRSSTALSQLCYWGKCLCGDQGLTMPSDAWIRVILSPPDLAAICMASAALDEHFLPCHGWWRQPSKSFPPALIWKTGIDLPTDTDLHFKILISL